MTGLSLSGNKLFAFAGILALALLGSPTHTEALQTPPAGTCYVYPSPATGASAWVVYTMPQNGTATIRVFTESGDLAAEDEETLPAGLQRTTLDLAYYHAGVYLCRVILSLDDGTTQKFPIFKFAVIR
jgi:hypothetical protein